MNSINRLLHPRSVAVIGASADPSKTAGRPVSYLLKHAFGGKIYPVNPKVDAIAGLTAVDGATLMTTSYNVLAFGAKIIRRRTHPTVERVMVTEPILNHTPEVVTPSQLGGTRHFSAAQFVQDQPDATALVASQDGKFTIFQWSDCETIVHAHRVEALLL